MTISVVYSNVTVCGNVSTIWQSILVLGLKENKVLSNFPTDPITLAPTLLKIHDVPLAQLKTHDHVSKKKNVKKKIPTYLPYLGGKGGRGGNMTSETNIILF